MLISFRWTLSIEITYAELIVPVKWDMKNKEGKSVKCKR